jgi:hypothetical protein
MATIVNSALSFVPAARSSLNIAIRSLRCLSLAARQITQFCRSTRSRIEVIRMPPILYVSTASAAIAAALRLDSRRAVIAAEGGIYRNGGCGLVL